MSKLNGLGPNNEGKLTGRGRGSCLPTSNTVAKVGIGLGMGMGIAWGYRHGRNHSGFKGFNRPGFRGFNRFNMSNAKDETDKPE